ncbi:MAG: type II secretion system protein [Oscillospiraceae bacterium]|nr:type II secretion system protein [Oscillospiraceae bacterium]
MKKTLKGFTLIELGFVLVILSILTGLIVPSLQSTIRDANIATDVANAKVIYENSMLLAATDEDMMISMYQTNSSNSYKPLYHDSVKGYNYDGIGEFVGWTKDGKTDNTKKSVVTRMDGVNLAQRRAYARLNGTGTDDNHNDGKSHSWDGSTYTSGRDGDTLFYTWEPVADANKSNPRASFANQSGDTWVVDRSKLHSKTNVYFTVGLSEKMNMPIYGDAYEGGTLLKSGNSKTGAKVDRNKPYLRMRYIVHETPVTGQAKAAYRWFIMCDQQTREITIESSWGQSPEYGSYQIYPPRGVYENLGGDEVKQGTRKLK